MSLSLMQSDPHVLLSSKLTSERGDEPFTTKLTPLTNKTKVKEANRYRRLAKPLRHYDTPQVSWKIYVYELERNYNFQKNYINEASSLLKSYLVAFRHQANMQMTLSFPPCTAAAAMCTDNSSGRPRSNPKYFLDVIMFLVAATLWFLAPNWSSSLRSGRYD